MRIWKSTGLALALITCAVTCSAMDIEQDTLSNGIPVIVLPDSSADVAAIEVIYQVGGFAEQRPVTGISHMLEHMMFQGTEKHPKSAFTEELKKIGGLVNAFTSPDYTGYHELVPAEHLPHIMALEADRVQIGRAHV